MTNELPPALAKLVKAFEGRYTIAQRDLEALVLGFSDDDVEKLIADCMKVIDRLDADLGVFVRQVVHRIVVFEDHLAAHRVGQASPAMLSADQMDAIDRRVYQVFHQQNQATRDRLTTTIERGYRSGMSIADRKAFQKAVIQNGVVGIVRQDGSAMSVEATGKALLNTRINQLQAETQVSRYQQAGVKMVQFVAGGPCTFKGDGGTCEDLDGNTYPANDIPDEVRIPRHLYSQSRWLPVLDS